MYSVYNSNLDDPQHDDPKQRIAAAGNGSNLVSLGVLWWFG